MSHFIHLVETVVISEHNLTPSDVKKIDPMNYLQAKKLIAAKSALIRYVPGSEATVLVLELMELIIQSFEDPSLSPEVRIKNMWKVCITARIWRKSLQDKKLLLKDHFFTSPTATCIEMNAHNLIQLALKFKDKPCLFLPTLQNSQICETIFRFTRSVSSANSTIINFSVKSFFKRSSNIMFLE